MLWQSAGSLAAGGPIAVAEAQAATAAPEATAAAPVPPFPTADGGGGAAAAPAAPAPSGTGPARRESAEASAFSPAEVDVLRQLAARREQLEARARELDKRDALLKAAESRIDAKASALRELQAEVSRLLKARDEQQEAKVASLARLYESMKPKDAAAILQSLELDTLLLVAERIKERKLAPIMAEMNPTKARDLTAELVRKRQVEAAAARPALAAAGAAVGR